MNLYLASTLCWDYEVDEVIRIAKAKGFRGVEVWAEHIWFHNTDLEQIKKAAQLENMSLTLHAASWDLNICSLNQGIQKQSILEIEKSIDLAKVIGANQVTLHPGRLTINNYLREHLIVLRQNLDELVHYANQLDITLSLELMEPIKKEMITTPTAMNSLIAELPKQLKVTFDTAHVPINENLLHYYEALDQVDKIHLSDSTTQAYHVPLGKGELDIDGFLTEIQYSNKPIVLEGFDDSRDLKILKKNLNYLQKHCWLQEEYKL